MSLTDRWTADMHCCITDVIGSDYLTIAPWVPSLRPEQNDPKTHCKYIIYLIGEQCDWSIELFNRWELMLANVEKIALTRGYLPVFGRCDWGLSLHRSHCPHRHNQRYRVDIVYLLYLFCIFSSSTSQRIQYVCVCIWFWKIKCNIAIQLFTSIYDKIMPTLRYQHL